jgi:uncharacterized integral membrane protein
MTYPPPDSPVEPTQPLPGQPAAPEAQPPTADLPRPPAGLTRRGRVKSTRISAVWVGLIVAAVLMIALLIFIAQNSKSVTLHYLGFHGHASLAVLLLVATVAGVLLVAIPGTGRIVQLRRALKKNAATASQSKR